MSSSFELVGIERGVMQFIESFEYELRYPDTPELATQSDQFVRHQSGISESSIQDFVIDDAQKNIFALPLPRNQLSDFGSPDNTSPFGSVAASEVIFNPDGSGIFSEVDIRFTWRQQQDEVSGKQQIEVLTQDNQTLTYKLLKAADDNTATDLYAVVLRNPATGDAVTETFITGTTADGGKVDNEEGFDVASGGGIYEFRQVFEGANPFERFWFELWPSGRAFTVLTSDGNGDGILSDDEVFVQYGDWSIDEKNRMFITRYRSVSNLDSSGCFGEFDRPELACFLYNQRSWQMFAEKDERAYVHHVHRFDTANQGAFSSISFDNRYFDKLSERPNNAQRTEYLPTMPPKHLTGLFSIQDTIENMQFVVDPRYFQQQEESVAQMQFDNDGSYSFESFGANRILEIGDFYALEDHSVQLKPYGANGLHFARLHIAEEFDLVAKSGQIMFSFNTQEAALGLVNVLDDVTSSQSFADLVSQQWVLIDRDEDENWAATYLSITSENTIEIYVDETFTEVAQTIAIELQEDGSLIFSDSVTRLFIALGDATVKFTVTDEDGSGQLDSNLLISDLNVAQDMLDSLTRLDQINRY